MIVASPLHNSFATRSSPRPAPRLSRGSLHLPTPIAPIVHHNYAIVQTPLGAAGAIWKYHETPDNTYPSGFIDKTPHALLTRIIIPGRSTAELRKELLSFAPTALEVLGDRFGNFHPEVVPPWFNTLTQHIQAYFSDLFAAADDATHSPNWLSFWAPRLDWSQLSSFQRQVLEACANIPRGEHVTYGQIAKSIGKPKSSRAVGAALGANPWPVLIPCHRVLGKNKKLTGFSATGGIHAKRRLLSLENPTLF